MVSGHAKKMGGNISAVFTKKNVYLPRLIVEACLFAHDHGASTPNHSKRRLTTVISLLKRNAIAFIFCVKAEARRPLFPESGEEEGEGGGRRQVCHLPSLHPSPAG